MNFEREHEGLGATEAGVISSDSENHDPAEGGSLLGEANRVALTVGKSRSNPLRRDLASPSYGSRCRSK
jgi:hypothetical protein